MSFNDEAEKEDFQINVVIKIGTEYFSNYQIDSGLVVPSENIGLLNKVTINPTTVDIRNVNTTTASLTFRMQDGDDGDFRASAAIMGDSTNFLEKTCELYVGFITGSFDWADYKKFTTTRITGIKKVDNGYNFKCREITSLLKNPAFQTATTLDGNINDSQTTIDLTDASLFSTSGLVYIDSEFMSYTGKSGNQLTGVVRADISSTAADHSDGADVYLVKLREENPIDLMLDIMQTELGISASDINIAKFISIRDANFSTTQMRFYLFATEVDEVIKFFEREILQPLNCRIIMEDSQISLALLDQTDFNDPVPDVDEETIIGTPGFELNSDKVVNRVIVRWNYDDGQDVFTRKSEFFDADSEANFPNGKTLEFKFKGVRADLAGSVIAQNMGNRLLARTKNPRASMSVNMFLSQSDLAIGDDISLTHRYLPQQGGGLGMSDQRLEIMSNAFDFDRGIVKNKVEFTSFSGLRYGLIAPSPLIQTVIDQKTFTVPDGTLYKAGYFLQLFDTDYLPDAPNEIESIDGNQITMEDAFTTPLTTSLTVKFPCYDDASGIQRSKYMWIGFNTGFFADGTKSYEILF